MKKRIWITPGSASPIICTYNNKQFFGFLSTGLAHSISIKKPYTRYIFSLDD
jgi:hypothetical protein